MTQITVQDGKVVMHGDKVGTEEECCCGCNCPLDCCLTIQGRNACEGGTDVVSVTPLIVENWGQVINPGGSIFATWEYISDERDLFLDITWTPCQNGVVALDIVLTESVPGGGAVTSRRRWATAVATFGEDGCQNGVTLGELTESEGPEPVITLSLGWICT